MQQQPSQSSQQSRAVSTSMQPRNQPTTQRQLIQPPHQYKAEISLGCRWSGNSYLRIEPPAESHEAFLEQLTKDIDLTRTASTINVSIDESPFSFGQPAKRTMLDKLKGPERVGEPFDKLWVNAAVVCITHVLLVGSLTSLHLTADLQHSATSVSAAGRIINAINSPLPYLRELTIESRTHFSGVTSAGPLPRDVDVKKLKMLTGLKVFRLLSPNWRVAHGMMDTADFMFHPGLDVAELMRCLPASLEEWDLQVAWISDPLVEVIQGYMRARRMLPNLKVIRHITYEAVRYCNVMTQVNATIMRQTGAVRQFTHVNWETPSTIAVENGLPVVAISCKALTWEAMDHINALPSTSFPNVKLVNLWRDELREDCIETMIGFASKRPITHLSITGEKWWMSMESFHVLTTMSNLEHLVLTSDEQLSIFNTRDNIASKIPVNSWPHLRTLRFKSLRESPETISALLAAAPQCQDVHLSVSKLPTLMLAMTLHFCPQVVRVCITSKDADKEQASVDAAFAQYPLKQGGHIDFKALVMLRYMYTSNEPESRTANCASPVLRVALARLFTHLSICPSLIHVGLSYSICELPIVRLAAFGALPYLEVFDMMNMRFVEGSPGSNDVFTWNRSHGKNKRVPNRSQRAWMASLMKYVPIQPHRRARDQLLNDMLGNTALEHDNLHESTTLVSTLGYARYYRIFCTSTQHLTTAYVDATINQSIVRTINNPATSCREKYFLIVNSFLTDYDERGESESDDSEFEEPDHDRDSGPDEY